MGAWELLPAVLLADAMLIGALLARARRRLLERRQDRRFSDELTPERLGGLEEFVR